MEVDQRVGELEGWRKVVDFRLDEGEKRFSKVEASQAILMADVNKLEKHILLGNHTVQSLKESWDKWLETEQQNRNNRLRNRPQWIHTALVGLATLCSIVALIKAFHG